jgi:hypothetical protein
MRTRFVRFALVVVAFASLTCAALAQEIRNWPAPLLWSPAEKATRAQVGSSTEGLEPQGEITVIRPLAFVAITPCRLADTRPAFGFPVGYGAPALVAGATRDFDLNSAAHCPGIPADVGAYSLNVTVTQTQGPGDIRIWPTGNFAPVSTQNWPAAGVTLANAAIVPAGIDGSVTVQAAVSGTHIIIDINGYYSQDFPNVTRSVHIPLLSFIGCTGGTPTLLDTTSGADTAPDLSYLGPDGGIRIFYDIDPGFQDQNSTICSEFVVPPDYFADGRFRIVADKGGHSGTTEVLNCAAVIGMLPMGAAGTVEIDSASPTPYLCAPNTPGLSPGQRVHFGLSITSSGTMDNVVLLLSVEFTYQASQ